MKVSRKVSHPALCAQWMDIEKERGISISSTALTFPYNGHQMNLLDTPVSALAWQALRCSIPHLYLAVLAGKHHLHA